MKDLKVDEKPNQNICLLCAKEVMAQRRLTGIFNNPRMLSLLSKGTGVNIIADKCLPDTVCLKCIITVNLHLEFQNRTRRNIMKLRLNHCIKIGDFKRVKRYQKQSSSNIDLFNGTHTPLSDECINADIIRNHEQLLYSVVEDNDPKIIISDVRTEVIPDLDKYLSYCDTDDTTTTDKQEQRNVMTAEENPIDRLEQSGLLEPMFQTSENVSDTESGGNIHVQNDEITARQQRAFNKFSCNFCPKVYRKLHFMKKHMRKHQSQKRNENRIKAKYICHVTECQEVFDSMHLLRKHCLTHDKILKCPACPETFVLHHDYSWHVVQCQAVQESVEADNNKNTDSQVSNGGRRTRSQCLALSIHNIISKNNVDNAENDDDQSVISFATDRTDPMFHEKQSYINNWKTDMTPAIDSNEIEDDYDCISDISSQYTTETDTDATSVSSYETSRYDDDFNTDTFENDSM